MNAVIRMETHYIKLDHVQYPYRIIRTNARRLSVRFIQSTFIVRAPRSLTASEIEHFFLVRKQSILQLVMRDHQRQLISLEEGSHIAILGQDYTVFHYSKVECQLHQLFLRPNHLKQDFLSLLQPLLLDYVGSHYRTYANILLNREPPELIFKWLTSRYGQYHTRHHRITLSLMLAFYEEDLIDYVIVHELAHALIPAHNKEFYRLISLVLPDYRARQRRLRQKGEVIFS